MYSLWRRHEDSQQLPAFLKSLKYLPVAQKSNRHTTTTLNTSDFLSYVFTYDSPSGKRFSYGYILGSLLSVLIRTFQVYFYCSPIESRSRYHNRFTHYIVRRPFIFPVDIRPYSLLLSTVSVLFTHRDHL